MTRARFLKTPVGEEEIARAQGLMPSVSRMAGHRGAVWLINRDSGEGVALDLYERQEDLDNTSQGDLRDALIELLEGELVSVEVFEVAGVDRLLDSDGRGP